MNLHNATDIDESTRYRLLADAQRRFVIESLETGTTRVQTSLDELATHLERAAERSDVVDGWPTLRCRLHHVHLPMLAEAGLLDYDPATKEIQLGGPWAVTATAESN